MLQAGARLQGQERRIGTHPHSVTSGKDESFVPRSHPDPRPGQHQVLARLAQSAGVLGARRRGRLRAIPAGQNFENKIFIVTFFFP